jgi:hypothetical protein
MSIESSIGITIGRWSTGGHHPGLVLTLSENDLERVGNCWMRGRLRAGDVVMCMEHSGDCFWNYALLECFANGYRLIAGSKFGAYTLGTPHEWQPTTREFHLLMAGESVLTTQARPTQGTVPTYILSSGS